MVPSGGEGREARPQHFSFHLPWTDAACCALNKREKTRENFLHQSWEGKEAFFVSITDFLALPAVLYSYFKNLIILA